MTWPDVGFMGGRTTYIYIHIYIYFPICSCVSHFACFFFLLAHAAGPACGGAGRAGEARNLAMDEAAMQGYVGVVQG